MRARAFIRLWSDRRAAGSRQSVARVKGKKSRPKAMFLTDLIDHKFRVVDGHPIPLARPGAGAVPIRIRVAGRDQKESGTLRERGFKSAHPVAMEGSGPAAAVDMVEIKGRIG